jgi:hypothetical protein
MGNTIYNTEPAEVQGLRRAHGAARTSLHPLKWSKLQGIPKKHREVLRNLSEYADADGGRCFPSIATQATDLERRPSSVIESIQWLQSQGLIIVHKRPGRVSHYTLVLNRVIPKQPKKAKPVQFPAEVGTAP